MPISAKGIDFKSMCQSRVDTAIKISVRFKNVGYDGGIYPFTIVRMMLHYLVRPLMKYGLGVQHLLKKERDVLGKARFRIWKQS